MGIDRAKKAEKALKKKQALKAASKLKRMHGKKKLKRHVLDAFNEIKSRRGEESRKKAMNINEDWEEYRKEEESDVEEETLPLDMIDEDDDMDWANSAFAASAFAASASKAQADDEDRDMDDLESKARRTAKTANYRELLPIKVKGKLVNRRVAEEEEADFETAEDADASGSEAAVESTQEEDVSNLNAFQLLNKRKKLLDEAKSTIGASSCAVIADPQQQIGKLKGLLLMCLGQGVHSLIRETTQKLATASLVQIFVDIIPGYSIRLPTEAEQEQKLKKETKKLLTFEQTLLRNYMKYLQFLEKNAMRLLSHKNKSPNESTFTFKMAMLSVNCFCRLLKGAPHFNYATNIISTVVKISACKIEQAVDECCDALEYIFRNDVAFRVSAFGTRAIATVVNQKKCDVSPKLLATLLKLNIKEVDKGEKSDKKEKLINKKFKLAKERKSKSRNKYAKQLSKLEADLKEAEAAESMTTKKKYATETMKHVFATYFRVIKRMPNTNLLEPVLEGISKFAHLLNVEFFDDIIAALESLVEQQHLHVRSSLHCIHAVFVILSGEGVALNVDPFRFYRSMYRLIPSIPFEKSPEVCRNEVSLMLQTLEIMLITRRKQVPLARVAAFVKRLIDVSLFVPDACTLALLAFTRSLFLAHPLALSLVDGSEVISGGLFKPEIDDPDCCNALSSSIEAELKILTKHPNGMVVQFADHVLAKIPSTGSHRLSSQLSTRKPREWLKVDGSKSDAASPHFQKSIVEFCTKQKSQITSKNLQSVICKWCESYSR